MDIIEHNRRAWNQESRLGSPWSTPVDPEIIQNAKRGRWQVILTPVRMVPAEWFGELRGKDLLCLASGGGQQAPVLAAAGANVISFDLSEEQLAKDRLVAERDNLSLQYVQGDMADLSGFDDASFDLIFHPISNVFVPDVNVVWRECYRVLKPGGVLLAGFMHPGYFLFDHDEAFASARLVVRHRLPLSIPEDLDEGGQQRWRKSSEPAQFSHSLEAQIGGQLAAGLVITGLYEDYWSDEATLLNRYSPTAIATRAMKPALATITN